jgi:SAM-dependent methyltransferase
MSQFTREYYEDGVRKGISGYENYRWMPTRSIPEALEIKNYFNPSSVLDYGCAKGYLVHALRMLGVQACGEDISDYAIENCHPKVKDFISKPNNSSFTELVICKDILEHVHEEDLPELLTGLQKRGSQFFFVIPLGDEDRFRIREYEVDVTHVTKKDEEWWFDLFESCGYRLTNFSYSFGAVKHKWIEPYPYGNGFFCLERAGAKENNRPLGWA